jgi:hypothetical protein
MVDAVLRTVLVTGAVVCSCAGGYAIYQAATPTPTPTIQPAPTVQRVPDTSGYLSLANYAFNTYPNDTDRVSKIESQLPATPAGDHTLSGQQAVSYANDLAKLIPEVDPAVKSILKAARCPLQYGVIAVKAYVTPQFDSATAAVVISRHAATNPPLGLAVCLVKSAIANGGPGGPSQFSPIAGAFQYNARFPDGTVDTFYVLLASTNTQVYNDFYATTYARFSPTSI